MLTRLVSSDPLHDLSASEPVRRRRTACPYSKRAAELDRHLGKVRRGAVENVTTRLAPAGLHGPGADVEAHRFRSLLGGVLAPWQPAHRPLVSDGSNHSGPPLGK